MSSVTDCYNELEEKYKITDFTLYDMYPDTYHIESVVRLQRI